MKWRKIMDGVYEGESIEANMPADMRIRHREWAEELGDLNDGSVFRAKTWTPYLIHGRVIHRSPPDGGKADRILYRWYVNITGPILAT